MSNNLQLSLKTEWFEMTKAGIKLEDYREVTPYWANRFLGQSQAFWKGYLGRYVKREWDYVHEYSFKDQDSIDFIIRKCGGFKKFTHNIMTLGYPKKGDSERIIEFEHAGIEIREGREEWGAEPGKLYFVIKHGKRL